MEKPESLSSCRSASDVSYYVKNKVELCIQNYMSLERTAKYLEKNHQISKTITHSVWEQLRKENPDFFVHFDLRCQMDLQMRMFNDMLTRQAVQMFENGLLDICDASSSVRSLLRQKHPERVHLLERLASKRKMGSAMHNPSSPSAAQWQMPNQQLLYASSLSMSATNVISVTPLPTANGPSMTPLPDPYNQQDQPHQYSLSTYNDLIDNSVGAPTFAPVDTDDWLLHTYSKFADLSKFDLGGDIGHNGPSCLDVADTLIHFDEQQQHHLIGQKYQPHWQQQEQQNVQVVERSNGLENGELIDEYLCNNFDQQQAGGVERGHHPESEALNNPDSGFIGDNGPCESYIKSAAQLVMQPSGKLQQQNGHYQQQIVPVETPQPEGSKDHEFCNNFEQKLSKRMCPCVGQQQAGRVKRDHPESEALYNP